VTTTQSAGPGKAYAGAGSAARDGWPDPDTLRWSTVALGAADIDPFALAVGHKRLGPGTVIYDGTTVVATSGVAAILRLPRGVADSDDTEAVRAWLATVPCGASAPGRVHGVPWGPTAVGAMPFARSEPATLVVPELSYCRVDGRAFATVVTPAGPPPPWTEDADGVRAELASRLAGTPHSGAGVGSDAEGAARPARLRRLEVQPTSLFTDGVRRALGAIGETELTKVVLARRIVATFDKPPDPVALLRRLRAREPATVVYGVIDDAGAFVGASPELLVRRSGTTVSSRPFAGTVGLTGDPAVDASGLARLANSPKEADEHRQVVDAVVAGLSPLCKELRVPESPTVARLATVAHLATEIDGTLSSPLGALTLAGRLHPTPAVAGTPTPAALDLLRALEPGERGRYAGPVGWMDADGDGEFVVAIRGATVQGQTALVHVGAGIVAGSVPEQELAETTLKLHAVLEALGWRAT
jgi:menaquinone-specific isochorismate synthase